MAYTIPIPLALLETLQGVFHKEARSVCIDVAKSLGIPKEEVIKRVLVQQPKVELQVFECETPAECPVLTLKDEIYMRCRRPCLLGTERCSLHQITKFKEPTSKQKYQRLCSKDGALIGWKKEGSSDVFNGKGELIGEFRDECFRTFTFE
jgi:hypothetical protein